MSAEIEVTTTPVPLVIGATGLTEILQNVRVILGTPKGSVVLDRAFGVDMGWLDAPTPEAKARCAASMVQAVQRYEPRVSVARIDWRNDATDAGEGRLKPVLRIRVKEGVL
ncbi:GPW/gp25 family protein [Desulfocurvibacter africanus]|uniref:GPW/gp25 family protein n=1 Tax=Desulfocurvibacter africanus subsp. africanus str. Walvis Bay TaxID=690850 RepID=F3YY62_DESAF|nr:GPW/gp25 family protein [Desulfocurvibacter africanus]EGJ51838.1 GPW/gp25 family protein [Desulfocurvibacter africanus subsp. africanus str. Walvis Bay]